MSFLSIYLTISIISILFINSIILIVNKYLNNNKVLNYYVSINGYGCALMFILSLLFISPYYSINSAVTLPYLWGFTNTILVLMVILSAVILLSVNPKKLNETALLISFSTLGLILMVETSHLVGFYLGVELYSFSAYILASGAENLNNNIDKTCNEKDYAIHKTSVSAGLKYFLLSALSSGLLVAGISFVYACTGELTIAGLSRFISMYNTHYFNENNLYLLTILGISLIISTLAFKIGSAPFHFWVPDVYSKVSLFVNFYLISCPKIGILYTLIKFCLSLPIYSSLIFVFSILSLVVGALGGLVSLKINRLLAYSSINHVGYILLALYAAHIPYTIYPKVNGYLQQSTQIFNLNATSSMHIYSICLYLIIYTVMTVNIFSIIYLLKSSNFKYNNYVYISSLKGLNKVNPFLAASLAITLLSMAGVPPLAGFVAKLTVYSTVLDSFALIPAICSIM